MAVNKNTDNRRRDTYFVGGVAESPADGALWIDAGNNDTMQIFRGNAFVSPSFRQLKVAAGYASTNNANGILNTVPIVVGKPGSIVHTLISGTAALVFDSVSRALTVSPGNGSWFNVPSMTLL